MYRYQLELGQRLIAGLTAAERKQARQPKAPVQTAVELQGSNGTFHGVAVADLGSESRRRVKATIDGILNSYAETDAAYAWECIDHNGGVEGLHLADYAEDHQPSRNVGDGPSQIFRLEGPSTVFHYRGEPHLHALFNVGMNGDEPLSVGEVVAENPIRLDRAAVKKLFETILLAETDSDLAYYNADSVAGPLRAGTIRTGDLYNLESWREEITIAEVEGADLGEPLVQAMRERGDTPRKGSRYRIATTPYVTGPLAETVLGRVVSEESGPMLRDAAIAYLGTYGFPS